MRDEVTIPIEKAVQSIEGVVNVQSTTSDGVAYVVIMNEFGRDPDGSSTNGFFNHRTNTESCRMAWSMVLGPAVKKPEIVERVVRQIDFAPSIGAWMGFETEQAKGARLAEIAV